MTQTPPALDLGGIRTTRRTGKTRRPELALSRGPVTLGQAGTSWASLLGSRWVLAWSALGLALYQLSGDLWAPVPADLPVLPGAARHLGLCFDQAANPVICWEDSGALYVRQFDLGAGVYVTRGPFEGHDPLLSFDALVTGRVAGSDVVLLGLSADRLHVLARHQRDLYGSPRTLATLEAPGVIDQAIPLPWAVQLAGEMAGSELVLKSEFYPLALSDQMAAAVGAPSGGALVGLVIVQAAQDQPGVSAAVGAPSGGALVGLVIVQAAQDQPGVSAAVGAPSGGALVGLVIVRTGQDQAGAATGAPAGGVLASIVINLQAGNAVQSSTTAPTGGTLQ